ncbi:hypothetical protein FRC11_012262 [Ceratobasidium sp. 423]|nr:hypothetical protein FRC11_012262 [Ceratobasidium sp. 423]
MLYYATQFIFQIVASASAALVSEAVSTVTDAIRSHWANRLDSHGSDKAHAPVGNIPDAYTIETADETPMPTKKTPVASAASSQTRPASNVSDTTTIKPTTTKSKKVIVKFHVPSPRGTNNTPKPRLDRKPTPTAPWNPAHKPKSSHIPKSANPVNDTATQEGNQSHAQAQAQDSATPTTRAPQAPSTNAANSTNDQGDVQARVSQAPNVPGSAGYIVPFPDITPHPLRASQSAPARISRMNKPSLPRSIIPAKRLVNPQHTAVEPIYTKRRHIFHPYRPPVEAVATPPRGGHTGLSIPSPLPESPSNSISRSDSVMSLTELTRGRPVKRNRATPMTRHDQSSSGKPGALAHVSSMESISTTQDVDMTVLDAMDTPEVTMSSPDLEDLDEWMDSTPPTPTLDDEMRSPFDEDVDMEEAWGDEDEEMWEVYRDEDVGMGDWMDEDVVMEGVT